MGLDRRYLERKCRIALKELEPGLRKLMGARPGSYQANEAQLQKDLGLWVTLSVIGRWLACNQLIESAALERIAEIPEMGPLCSSVVTWPDEECIQVIDHALSLDLEDPGLDSSLLGDLYQDRSEGSRKDFALVQTPAFVVKFLLQRTLEPAVSELPIGDVTLIDPSCGTGHFLVPAFYRLALEWSRTHPDWPLLRSGIQALARVAGVDINPAVVAIARLRLRVALAHFSGVRSLDDLPSQLPLNVVHGDALLHGERSTSRNEPDAILSRSTTRRAP